MRWRSNRKKREIAYHLVRFAFPKTFTPQGYAEWIKIPWSSITICFLNSTNFIVHVRFIQIEFQLNSIKSSSKLFLHWNIIQSQISILMFPHQEEVMNALMKLMNLKVFSSLKYNHTIDREISISMNVIKWEDKVSWTSFVVLVNSSSITWYPRSIPLEWLKSLEKLKLKVLITFTIKTSKLLLKFRRNSRHDN